MDAIFGFGNFRNEIVWKRTSSLKTSQFKDRKFGTVTDTILFYTKSDDYFFDSENVKIPFTNQEIIEHYPFEDAKGRFTKSPLFRSMGMGERPNLCYEYKGVSATSKAGWKISLDKLKEYDKKGDVDWTNPKVPYRKYRPEHTKGWLISNLWSDIEQTGGNERLGYPTQKPIALLERIIKASSNEGDVILDPFCGCGTAIVAAQNLNRKWIGIDITHLSIALMKYRLKDTFHLEPKKDYNVVGEPEDVSSALQLANDDRYQFQWWALSLIKARPAGAGGEKKKGADKGIDGLITFIDDQTGKGKRVLVQVKSGHVKSGDVRDLIGVLDREKAEIGIFITLNEPTRDMLTEAISAGLYHSEGWQRDYPKVQILTITELLNGKPAQLPPTSTTFKNGNSVVREPDQIYLNL